MRKKKIDLDDARKLARAAVPTNWCDPLLTGPDAVLPKGGPPYDCRHIEALLRGVQDCIDAAFAARARAAPSGGSNHG